MEIASTLKLTIQHEQDLAISAGAFVVSNPNATQADFLRWTSSARAFQRYPEVVGIAELKIVSASQLNAFATQARTDPAGPLAANGAFLVTPVGNRPYYCLATASEARGGPSTTPAAFDFCATELGAPLIKARDTGLSAYLPYGTGKNTELVVGTPVYRGGVTPSTVQARREEFLGWTGTSIKPSMILEAALINHPSTGVAFHYVSSSSRVTLNAGKVPVGAQAATTDLHNGWHVVVFGQVASSALFANDNAIGLLFGGFVLSLLLATVFFLLGTSRTRALLLVHERTEQLRHQAFHDPLTGLPNRALILDRIKMMLARSHRDLIPMAALFIDLDDFKDINDTLGHEVGDQLLVVVAARLATVLREADTVGRLGGDEFVVLLGGSSMDAGAEVVAKRILDAFGTPFEIPGNAPLSITASIGIATGGRPTPDELLRDADIALYQAKGAGKHRAVTFTASMQDAVDDHRYLDVDLHAALEAGEFFLLYQPIVDLSTGAIMGVEALVRWRHPRRGVVEPSDFIPALESSGLIVAVGNWVLREACLQGALWQRRSHRLIVSVNVAAAQLEQHRFVDDVKGALSASGLDPTLLTLELTETTLMRDPGASAARLKLLKAIGVHIAIDDFGTGYSSMTYLQRFPIDILKIDYSFVSDITDRDDSAALVHTLVQLGKVLELTTTAEGVETEEQRMWLRAEGVDRGQGFLFGRPMKAGAVIDLLEDEVDHFELPFALT